MGRPEASPMAAPSKEPMIAFSLGIPIDLSESPPSFSKGLQLHRLQLMGCCNKKYIYPEENKRDFLHPTILETGPWKTD
jgi:hypothetical protein